MRGKCGNDKNVQPRPQREELLTNLPSLIGEAFTRRPSTTQCCMTCRFQKCTRLQEPVMFRISGQLMTLQPRNMLSNSCLSRFCSAGIFARLFCTVTPPCTHLVSLGHAGPPNPNLSQKAPWLKWNRRGVSCLFCLPGSVCSWAAWGPARRSGPGLGRWAGRRARRTLRRRRTPPRGICHC